MRTSNIFMATAMMAATFALGACSNSDEPEVVDLTKPIQLDLGVGSVTQTRVTIADNAAFESGNSIGLFMGALTDDVKPIGTLGSITKFDNIQYTVDGNNAWTGNAIYWQNTAQYHTLYAYSPYAQTVSNYKIPFTLEANQADASTYKAVDFLWNTATTKATTSTVTIQLKHKMSLIKVNMTKGDGMTDAELTALTMSVTAPSSGIKAAGVFDLSDGTCTAAANQGSTSALTTVSPYRTGNMFYAIVMPGTKFTNDTDFIKLTATDGTVYLYKLSLSNGSDLDMVGGNMYEFTLKANKKGISLTQFTISTWTAGTGDSDGNADMEVK